VYDTAYAHEGERRRQVGSLIVMLVFPGIEKKISAAVNSKPSVHINVASKAGWEVEKPGKDW
jgi:hypothetical protein